MMKESLYIPSFMILVSNTVLLCVVHMICSYSLCTNSHTFVTFLLSIIVCADEAQDFTEIDLILFSKMSA